jgi:hypothetical protein
MGAGFCNLSSLKWLTEKPLTPNRLYEQRTKQSHKVGREGEGLSSNRPELVALWECLEAHPDNENLLYLTDREATLQVINKWIGGEAKLSLSKTADVDILRVIVIKLQRVARKDLDHADQQNHLSVVKSLRNQEWDKHLQGNSVDPDGPQQNVPEGRGDPSLPRIREGSGKVAQGAHAEKRTRRYF